MYLDAPLFCQPSVEEAIDRYPLVIALDCPLQEAIALMGQRRMLQCPLEPKDFDPIPSDPIHWGATHLEAPHLEPSALDGRACNLATASPHLGASPSSCALILQGKRPLGILTERDIVRLTAQGLDDQSIPVGNVMASPVITLAETEFQNVFSALFLFRRYKIRHLVLVDEQQHLRGVVSQDSLRQLIRPANLLKMRRVSDVMTSPVVHAFESTSVLQLARLMTEHRVSCVVILEEDPDYDLRHIGMIPVGIVTERDIVQFQGLQLDLAAIPARDVMSTPLFLLGPGDSLLTAYEEMQRRRVRRLVVSWDWGKGLGIVTQTSLLRIFDPMEMYSVIDSLQQTVERLQAEVRQLRQG